MRSSAWVTHVPVARPRARVFCLPCAGGGASMFRGWGQAIGPTVEVHAVQLPGRETRCAEPPLPSIAAMADELARVLLPRMDLPFALFGHSMGALVCFELAHRLEQAGGPRPSRLVVSAHRAPSISRPVRQISTLPGAELVQALQQLGGMPPHLLASAELLELVLPTMRADFHACETYTYTPAEPIGCPIIAMGGVDDDAVPRADLEGWRIETRSSFELRGFSGGHFYLNRHTDALAAVVREGLS
jgi:medium-chain acyl-[acyl-carrier-protein] hydrolase